MLVHTGQNYDRQLNEVFFEELGIREPDHFLAVDTSSLGTVLGGRASQVGAAVQELRPDAVLVLGDTNSAIVARDGQAHAHSDLSHGGRKPFVR